jgi:hypothetical protein
MSGFHVPENRTVGCTVYLQSAIRKARAPGFSVTLANCEKARAVCVRDRCNAVCGQRLPWAALMVRRAEAEEWRTAAAVGEIFALAAAALDAQSHQGVQRQPRQGNSTGFPPKSTLTCPANMGIHGRELGTRSWASHSPKSARMDTAGRNVAS